MAPTTKEGQQAAQDDLRESVDGWDFKTYVLGQREWRGQIDAVVADLEGVAG